MAGFTHVNIAADDPAALLAWYETVFGGERGAAGEYAGGSGLRLGGMTLVFGPRAAGAPPAREQAHQQESDETDDKGTIHRVDPKFAS